MSNSAIKEMSLKDPLTWENVVSIVKSYNLDKLGRSVDQLQKYHDFKDKLASEGVDITTNLLINALHWLPETTDHSISGPEAVSRIHCQDPRSFCNPNDVTITVNDFPYFIKERTLHLLVWVKFPMLPDPTSVIGDISTATKAIIQKYIDLTFHDYLKVPENDLIWWKNYTIIQSIKTIPHIHVLINLDNDHNGTMESSVRSLIGSSGVMFSYANLNKSNL